MAQPGQHPDDAVRCADDIDEVLSRANPNPERLGCPPRDTLIGLARRAQPIGDPAYEHLLKCSPCYREFRALQEEQAGRPFERPGGSRAWWMAAAAVAVLVAGITWIWVLFGSRTSPGASSSTGQSQIAAQRTELDLRNFTVARSQQASEQPTLVSLPIGRVDLTLLMPVGSEPGPYEVQLLDADLQPRASARGAGEIRDFVTTIQTTIDLRAVPSGVYQLGVRREGDDWRLFPVRVR